MEQRRWLVSGASSGIGRALVELLAERGDVVLGTVRRDTDRQRLEELGPHVQAVSIDLNEPSAVVETAVRDAIASVGGLDVLVNNAGYGLVGAIEETSEEEARHQMETNFWGAWKLVRAALPTLRASRQARILNVSSTAGFQGVPAMGIYNASKFALEGMSHALRLELAEHAIAVTIVEPGAFRTDWAGGGLRVSANALPEYAGSTAERMRTGVSSLDGRQAGDPRLAAAAMITIVETENPPLRLQLGPDAVATMRKHLSRTGADLDTWAALGEETVFAAPA